MEEIPEVTNLDSEQQSELSPLSSTANPGVDTQASGAKLRTPQPLAKTTNIRPQLAPHRSTLVEANVETVVDSFRRPDGHPGRLLEHPSDGLSSPFVQVSDTQHARLNSTETADTAVSLEHLEQYLRNFQGTSGSPPALEGNITPRDNVGDELGALPSPTSSQGAKHKEKLRQFFGDSYKNLMELVATDPEPTPAREEQQKRITKLTKFFGEKPGDKLQQTELQYLQEEEKKLLKQKKKEEKKAITSYSKKATKDGTLSSSGSSTDLFMDLERQNSSNHNNSSSSNNNNNNNYNNNNNNSNTGGSASSLRNYSRRKSVSLTNTPNLASLFGSSSSTGSSPRTPRGGSFLGFSSLHDINGVAFGIRRGSCTPPCDCEQFVFSHDLSGFSLPADSISLALGSGGDWQRIIEHLQHHGGPCENCGHFPASHKNLGKIVPQSPSHTASHVPTSPLTIPANSNNSKNHTDQIADQLLDDLQKVDDEELVSIHRNSLSPLARTRTARARSYSVNAAASPGIVNEFTTQNQLHDRNCSSSSPPSGPSTSNPHLLHPNSGESPPGSPLHFQKSPRTVMSFIPFISPRSRSPTHQQQHQQQQQQPQSQQPVSPSSSPRSPRFSFMKRYRGSTDSTAAVGQRPRSGTASTPPSSQYLSEEYQQKLKQIGDTLKKESAIARATGSSSFSAPGSPLSSSAPNLPLPNQKDLLSATPLGGDSPRLGTSPLSSFTPVHQSNYNNNSSSSGSSISISNSSNQGNVGSPLNPFGRQFPSSSSSSTKLGSQLTPATSPWVISSTEISFISKLGVGSSAKVYKGRYRNQEVAIKVLRTMPDDRQIEDFQKEFQIMSCLRSPHVVYFYGTVVDPKVCIVMEYCQQGSLHDLLRLDNATKVFDWAVFFKYAIEATKGVNCLHSWKPQIVHRDLKSLNLLIDENGTCKLADFGLSRFLSDGKQSTLGKVRGTYAYCCPEVYFGEQYSAKSDIYSLAIIFWEMVFRVVNGTYQRPYAEYDHISFDFQIILQSAKNNLRPTIPSVCPAALEQLMQNCWQRQPDHRISAEQLLEDLLQLQRQYEKEPSKWTQFSTLSNKKKDKSSH